MILKRTLRNDYAKYAREDDDLKTVERDISDESGWKLMHGDVFCPSRNLVLFSAVVGTGAQLAMLVLLVILLAIVRMLYIGREAIVTNLIAELGKLNHLHPDKGNVSIFVDCSPTAAPMFEGRGGEELSA
ncbi:hypothetical protein GIB67_023719 [Kingdonia uniflora]|uniref:Transmembrane 9 superfamily member n=1 Tax=Kingdonia uniflora TaxID=39325 RepID=A0A7J7MGJ1_9MAGN|nr:hypothetical protein GIB67_023719 [Kingdonia uniflora]